MMTKQIARLFDEYLVASARAGDRAALGQLVRHWQPKLLAHAYRLTGDGETARDVVQDGWADIVKGLPRLKETKVFPAWAYRIVTRRAADHIRRVQRKRRTEAAFAAEPETADTSTQDIESAAENMSLTRAIESLSPEHSASIALFYLEDFSVMEISIALEVPAGTIKTRLMHARKKLRAVLQGDENE